MKFLDKKLQRILARFSKGVLLLTIVALVFGPFAQILSVPFVQAAEGDSCTVTVGYGPGDERAPRVISGKVSGGACVAEGTPYTSGYTTTAVNNSTRKIIEPPKDALACNLSNVSVCLANVVYAFTVGLGSGLAYVGGFMLDTSIALSLNSSAYALSFLSSGWTTARDLANMAFILILVYIAFMIMFQAETARTIQMLAWVIFIALIINFSFFFTRVVIDVGNILAVQFYNSIPGDTMQKTFDTTNSNTGTAANTAVGIAQRLAPDNTFQNTKDLTASIMNALNIQQLFDNASFKKFAGEQGFGTKFIVLAFLYISVGACYFILAAMFFAVAIKFIVRVVVLWFLIIASPLAFVCKAILNKPNISGLYDKWQHELIRHAFYPAFFLFIFFFIATIMSTSFTGENSIMSGLAKSLEGLGSNPDLGAIVYIASIVATVGIRLGFVIAMLYIALKASEYMGTKGGEMAHSITSKITGAGISGLRYGAGLPMRSAAAAGGVLGRSTAGLAGNAISRSTTLRTLEKGPLGFVARGVRGAGSFVGDRTFDLRNAPGGKSVLGLGGALEVGSGAKNGYTKRVKAAADAKEKRAKDLEPTALEKQQADAKAKKKFGYAAAEKERDDLKALVNIGALRTRKLEEDNKKDTPEWENSVRSQKVDRERLAQAEDNFKKIKDQAEKRAKEISGEGLSKKYTEDALLGRFNVGAGNFGIVTRSSREAALKILKGKTKDQEVLDAIKKFASDENKGGDGGDKPDGGGSGGGGNKPSGGSSGGASTNSSGAGSSGASTGSSGGGSPSRGAHASASSGAYTAGSAHTTVSLDNRSMEELEGIREDLKDYAHEIASRLQSHPALGKTGTLSVNLNKNQLNVIGSVISKAARPQSAPTIPTTDTGHSTPPAANDNKKPGESKAA